MTAQPAAHCPIDPVPPSTSTLACGLVASARDTPPYASERLSDALATESRATPSGTGTRAAPNGTSTKSSNSPPKSPPSGTPHIAKRGPRSQSAVLPCKHAAHTVQHGCQGTTTVVPGLTPAPSPASTTSATHSCPIANGAWNGVAPATIARSRSHVVEATGRTITWSSDSTLGSLTSRNSSRRGATNSRRRTRATLSQHPPAHNTREVGGRNQPRPSLLRQPRGFEGLGLALVELPVNDQPVP